MLRPEKAAWRDLHSLLAIPPDHFRTIEAISHAVRSPIEVRQLNVAGIARGDEAAKILFWRHERMPVPPALLSDVNLIERLGRLLQEAEQVEIGLHQRTQRIAELYLAPDAEDKDGRQADPKEVARLCDRLDPRPAYWAWLEEHFFLLLEYLPDDWDMAVDDWKPDNQQRATNSWRRHVKHEARRALKASIRSLGTTARAFHAVALVRIDFNDEDLKPKEKKANKSQRKAKGGKKK